MDNKKKYGITEDLAYGEPSHIGAVRGHSSGETYILTKRHIRSIQSLDDCRKCILKHHTNIGRRNSEVRHEMLSCCLLYTRLADIMAIQKHSLSRSSASGS